MVEHTKATPRQSATEPSALGNLNGAHFQGMVVGPPLAPIPGPSRTLEQLVASIPSTSYSDELRGSVRMMTELVRLQRSAPGLPAKTGTGFPILPSPIPYHMSSSCRSTHYSEPLAAAAPETREECLVSPGAAACLRAMVTHVS